MSELCSPRGATERIFATATPSLSSPADLRRPAASQPARGASRRPGGEALSPFLLPPLPVEPLDAGSLLFREVVVVPEVLLADALELVPRCAAHVAALVGEGVDQPLDPMTLTVRGPEAGPLVLIHAEVLPCEHHQRPARGARDLPVLVTEELDHAGDRVGFTEIRERLHGGPSHGGGERAVGGELLELAARALPRSGVPLHHAGGGERGSPHLDVVVHHPP